MVTIALIGTALGGSTSATAPSIDVTALRDAQAPIINGMEEPEHLAAVGLGLDGLGITVCSGSLITPRIVLTAAHCTADFPEDLVTAIGVAFFGTRPGESDTRPIAEVRLHPDYVRLDPNGTTLGENDVAVIVLGEDADVAPIWFRTEPLDEVAVGTVVRSVGWGLDENDVSYIKRSAELIIDEIDPQFLISRASENPDNTSICSGDSGGPQYATRADGTLEQWSVHSWASSLCQGESGSVRTDVVSDWILEQIADVHGGADRCVAWGLVDDGVCDEGCDEPDPDCAVADDESGAKANGLTSTGCRTAPPAAGPLPWARRR